MKRPISESGYISCQQIVVLLINDIVNKPSLLSSSPVTDYLYKKTE